MVSICCTSRLLTFWSLTFYKKMTLKMKSTKVQTLGTISLKHTVPPFKKLANLTGSILPVQSWYSRGTITVQLWYGCGAVVVWSRYARSTVMMQSRYSIRRYMYASGSLVVWYAQGSFRPGILALRASSLDTLPSSLQSSDSRSLESHKKLTNTDDAGSNPYFG